MEQLNELGYYCVTRHPADARVLFPEARKAEELGLGAVHIGERFTVKEAAVLSGALAGHTTNLGIATAATNQNTRHPMITAAIGSTMHALTEGRFALGFARGVAAHWEIIGLPTLTEARMRDFTDLLRRLWAGERIWNHDGPAGKWPLLYHDNNLEDAPPIGFVGVGPKTLQMAGEIGDFVVLHTFFSDEATTASVEAVRRGAAKAGRDPDSVRIWAVVATIPDDLPDEDRLRRRVGRLSSYLQGYGDILVKTNGWDPGVWERIRTSEAYNRTEGAIDANATIETLEELDAMFPEDWLASAATGTAAECADFVSHQFDLGVHSVIMHGATPDEIAPVVEAYRDNRPVLKRAVAANPGRFAD
ncbi:TIGR03857 family LLM class F420-dependent oxidoreductase [Nocardioides sp. Kera G14]|uniref:TIGR03857 family LLM class F420-dependent oxidoreductase n=1 Tax=Nocardioides sp. Kera G14 TaxID=2884264 RepID=UPI001D100E5E|nr:TIGR03857 family LLM class F420-dependent oxidoreductase [Nocardioides sp. Kera G14]UDY24996.1 TIGR03857 family LLM class F420-dependent oxidoreductase [Nocardioides sp. Kera G14]